jgi:hypothetical protein
VLLQSVRYGATECRVGAAYAGNDTNLYRIGSDGHIEFLDIEKEKVPENLVQPVRDLIYCLSHRLLT